MIIPITGVVQDGATPIRVRRQVQPLLIPQGSDAKVRMYVVGENLSPKDITGLGLILTLVDPAAPSPAKIERLGTIVDGPGGIVDFPVTRAELDALSLNHQYTYDVWLSDLDQVVPVSSVVVTQRLRDFDNAPTTPDPVPVTILVSAAPPNYHAYLDWKPGTGLFWRQHERAKAVFNGSSAQVNVNWPSFGARPFEAKCANPVIAVADGFVQLELLDVTATGCTVQASDVFTGEVSIELEEIA